MGRSQKAATLIGAAAIGVLGVSVSPAWAGWDATNGANFVGSWSTTWQSPTGSYNSPLQLTGPTGAGTLTGFYNNGTVTGTVTPHMGGGGRDGWVYAGKWQRTGSDSSGGACQYGRFQMTLLDQGLTAGTQEPDLTYTGKWSYCDADPMDDANPQQWTGDQPQNLGFNGYVLPVPLYPQLTNMWCWAASTEMVVKYLYPAINIEQGDEANTRTGRTDCIKDPTPGTDAKPICNVGGWEMFDKYGVSFNENDETFVSKPNPDLSPPDPTKTVGYVAGSGTEAMSWDALKTAINAGQPVMFAWAWRMHPAVVGDRYVDGGHMMVARGWSTVGGQNYVFVNNPWSPQEGDEDIMPYDAWVGGLDQDHVHWADFSEFGRAVAAQASGSVPSGTGAGGRLAGAEIRVAPELSFVQTRLVTPSNPRILLPRPGTLLPALPNREVVQAEALRVVPHARVLAAEPQALRVLGLRTEAERREATLGQGLQEYTLSRGALASYRPPARPESLLTQPSAVLFPLVVNGAPRSAIRIQIRGEVARVGSFGSAVLIRQIVAVTPLTGSGAAGSSGIRVPALGLYFVTRESANELELAPVFDTPQLGLVRGRFEPASAVFARLAPFAAAMTGRTM